MLLKILVTTFAITLYKQKNGNIFSFNEKRLVKRPGP